MKVRMRYVADKRARMPIPEEIIEKFKQRPKIIDVEYENGGIVGRVVE